MLNYLLLLLEKQAQKPKCNPNSPAWYQPNTQNWSQRKEPYDFQKAVLGLQPNIEMQVESENSKTITHNSQEQQLPL